MTDLVPALHPVNIEDEMKRSYMDYAMSVIIGRALPDARDGLKPAHRRVLYGMKTMGLSSTRGYRKCAKIVGEVMGNFHPHGDASIYDTLVRMAQDFNMRYPLVDGQGNFGSIDGDPPAAMRYTEARLEALADGILDASILQVYEGRYRPPEKHEPKWVDHQAGKVARTLTALEAAPPALTATPDVGQIALACALGYRDFRFEGTWRRDHPRLVAWLDAFAARVPAFAATKPQG